MHHRLWRGGAGKPRHEPHTQAAEQTIWAELIVLAWLVVWVDPDRIPGRFGMARSVMAAWRILTALRR
jgi:hypothetical protein